MVNNSEQKLPRPGETKQKLPRPGEGFWSQVEEKLEEDNSCKSIFQDFATEYKAQFPDNDENSGACARTESVAIAGSASYGYGGSAQGYNGAVDAGVFLPPSAEDEFMTVGDTILGSVAYNTDDNSIVVCDGDGWVTQSVSVAQLLDPVAALEEKIVMLEERLSALDGLGTTSSETEAKGVELVSDYDRAMKLMD